MKIKQDILYKSDISLIQNNRHSIHTMHSINSIHIIYIIKLIALKKSDCENMTQSGNLISRP